jgi:transketolase
MNTDQLLRLKSYAYRLRVLSLEATTNAGSGHPTSALSSADLVAALFFQAMKYDFLNPANPANDRFILSKGHACPLLYAAWQQVGAISYNELMALRQFSSTLEGHPTPRFAYNEAATGSLGCGLSIGLGMALSSRIQEIPFFIYVLLGDSEMAEGSVWEAIQLAAYYKTNNLVALVDFNGLGQTTQTIDDNNAEKHADRWAAFGWKIICIDGHDMEEILSALDVARSSNRPTVIVAKTVKGYGLEDIEGKNGYHGHAFSKDELPLLLQGMAERFKSESKIKFVPPEVKKYQPEERSKIFLSMPPASYDLGSKRATRKAFGDSLAQAGSYDERIVSLDAEVKNSTFAQTFADKFPKRFIQSFVAEQNMIGMGVGFYERGLIPVCSTFASFITRAHDQLRMAAIDRAALRVVGSHAGVSIGEDGPSQMGLEDIGLMRSLPDSIILYPCDAVSTYGLLQKVLQYDEGISYLRLTRMDTPVIYEPTQEFTVGGCAILKESNEDQACIIAAGITVFEALKAYEELKKRHIMVSVIDLYSVKPLARKKILDQARKAHDTVITVEDHFLSGGLGEAVCFALRNEGIRIEVLAVNEISRSGKPQELLAFHRIDHAAIVQAVYSSII